MFKDLDKRIKKLSTFDIMLARFSAVAFGILLVKIFPQLLKLDYWVWIVLVLALGLKPLWSVWLKKP